MISIRIRIKPPASLSKSKYTRVQTRIKRGKIDKAIKYKMEEKGKGHTRMMIDY